MKSRKRYLCFFFLTLLGTAAILFLFRVQILVLLGNHLIVRDALHPSDAALVLSGEPTERVWEAASLYQEGLVPLVVLTTPPPPPGYRELEELEVMVPREEEIAEHMAIKLGVDPGDVMLIGEIICNTREEAELLSALSRQKGWKRVVVVTSPFHTRRSRNVFREALRGSDVEVTVVPSRYGEFRSDNWWKSRRQVRNLVFEYQKLVFYIFGL